MSEIFCHHNLEQSVISILSCASTACYLNFFRRSESTGRYRDGTFLDQYDAGSRGTFRSGPKLVGLQPCEENMQQAFAQSVQHNSTLLSLPFWGPGTVLTDMGRPTS